MHNLSWTLHNLKIEERRKEVASLLAKSVSETQIAHQLGVDQSTVSRDVKVLKKMSQRFVYDLAKSDLAYYYKQSIDGIEEAKKESWKIFYDEAVSTCYQKEIQLIGVPLIRKPKIYMVFYLNI
jgi:IS30 family transposase